MSDPEADAEDPATFGALPRAATLDGDATAPAPGAVQGADTSSVYDSLLRRVAAGNSRVQVDARVGPDGKFVLRQEIGKGGMGRVFRALDRYLLRDVAIKFIFRPEGMGHHEFMALFWQEAHIIARLDQHDNIVRILDVDRSAYPPFIVMEYLDGQSLESMLQRGPLDIRTALDIMIAAAAGLREAHTKDIYHRDLKPSNIFIQKTGRVKLLDFGLARLRNAPIESPAGEAGFATAQAIPPLTVAGTPAYMAPEQWRGEDTDAATDLWAVGVILYRLLARIPPFAAGTITALSARVLSGEPPVPLATLSPDLPPVLRDLVERLMCVDRARRPSDVSEVIATLESVVRTMSDAPSRAALDAPPSSSFWSSGVWTPGGPRDYLVHEAGGDHVLRYWDRLLMVLVLDADSGVTDLPHQLPGWVLGRAGVDVNVLHCPPGQAGELDDDAARLKHQLEDRFRRARHILFVTHGAGTSAVLRMLLAEARRLGAGERSDLASGARSFLYRTRHVAMLGPGRGVTAAHGTAGRHAGAATGALAAELAVELRELADANLPTPALYQFGIDGDEPGTTQDLTGLHASSMPVRQLARFLVRPDLIIARESIAQTFDLDCAAKIVSLIAPVPGAEDGAAPIVPGADGATQAELFERMLALVRTPHPRPVTTVITGDAGVGKSTVLRMLARRLSSESIASFTGDTVLPVLIPLYFVSLPSERVAAATGGTSEPPGRALLDLLLDWWCDWVGGLTYAGSITAGWVKARLRSEPVALLLDGVDEFITNHLALGISDFQQMLGHLTAEYRQNGSLTILLGVRSTQSGLSLLASGNTGNTHELLRLTPAQAVQQFPAASSWLTATTEASIKKLLLTPLILAQLNTRPPPSALRPSSHSDVLLLVLTTIIEQSDLCGRRDEAGQPIDAQRWIDALMVIAWCMFRRLRGEIAGTALQFEAGELHAAWSAHLDRTQQRALGDRMLSGFHLLCESRACDALLRRTILYPTGRGEVRFIHREWQDFLAARYLAQVVTYSYVDELRHIGYTSRLCRIAGEILCQAGVCIDEAFVQALFERTRQTGARLITANFGALLTNSRVLIDGPAIDLLLSAVRTMPAIARYIALNGLGYRALRGDDASAQDLRYRLIRVFRDYLSAPAADDDIGAMRSVAWCYLTAYAQRFGEPMPGAAWPGLGGHAERAVLAMMCSANDAGPRILPEHRSVQLAFLELQHLAIDDPCRPISAVHYLYCLVVARRHDAGIAELSRELPMLLARDSPYVAMIERYPLVPELREILATCRAMESRP